LSVDHLDEFQISYDTNMVNRNIHNPHFPQTCPSRQSSAGMNISMPLLPLILQERERERTNYQLDNEREVQHPN